MLRFLTTLALACLPLAGMTADTQSVLSAIDRAEKSVPATDRTGMTTEQKVDAAIRQAWGGHTGGLATGFIEQQMGTQQKAMQQADPKTQAEMWEALRAKLHLTPKKQLYIFVSWAMPESLLREYEADAADSGAALVMRGIPKDMDLATFIRQKVKGAFTQIGVQAPVLIDPRLFDLYQVTTVPTIVFTASAPDDMTCNTNQSCEQAAPDTYSSISGSVTLQYALEQFKTAGDAVGEYLTAMQTASGSPPNRSTIDDKKKQGEPTGVDEKEFLGRMEAVWRRNSELLAAEARQNGWEQYTSRYQTKWGEAIGPAGITLPDSLKPDSD